MAADPEGAPFDPVPAEGVYNADATASMVALRGELLAGSSRNGVLYALMPEGSREEPVARRESAVVE
ncbi:MAG: hypothetical protein QNK05_00290 [Myxococcota bacterium]|nr:hypothetical protein [Myxococcota bacterium]